MWACTNVETMVMKVFKCFRLARTNMFTYDMLSCVLNHSCTALACSFYEIANSCVNTLQTFSAACVIFYVLPYPYVFS